jgi:hypothetical protein
MDQHGSAQGHHGRPFGKLGTWLNRDFIYL